MYPLTDMAAFALSEFERGLKGLSDEDARKRLTKADGTEMNAISWTIGHIAGHWLHRPPHLQRYAMGSVDATPPPLAEMLALLEDAKAFSASWLPRADEALLARIPPDGSTGGENVGTALMRATLHTWFHAGEINAIRQMLGHREIPFVGLMLGKFEWK
jgi:hypothetical protein